MKGNMDPAAPGDPVVKPRGGGLLRDDTAKLRDDREHENWARALSKGLVQSHQLSTHQISTPDEAGALNKVNDVFDMRIPEIFIDSIKNGNDALKKQFVPSTQE